MRLSAFCFRNLLHRKVRTSLCIVGVALAATFVIAVGATTMRYTQAIREMSFLFSGQVVVIEKNTILVQAIPIGFLGSGMLPQNLTEEKLRGVKGVEHAIPILLKTFQTAPTEYQINPIPANFSMGIPVDDWRTVLGPTPLKGAAAHFPTNESSNEVVVGQSLADQDGLTVGTSLDVNGYDLVVTGILDTRLAMLSRCTIMPLKLAQKVCDNQGDVNMIAVKPQSGYKQQDLAKAIKETIPYANALTEDERIDVIQPILTQLETWNLGVETIVFAISLILVLTVMIMSVSERRRDFATLDAIGAPLSYVFKAVLFEASLIGALSAALGVALGSVGALVLASLYTSIPLSLFFADFFTIVPPLFMGEIFAAVVLVCCIGGIIPAINATRMRAAEVMRAEY